MAKRQIGEGVSRYFSLCDHEKTLFSDFKLQ